MTRKKQSKKTPRKMLYISEGRWAYLTPQAALGNGKSRTVLVYEYVKTIRVEATVRVTDA